MFVTAFFLASVITATAPAPAAEPAATVAANAEPRVTEADRDEMTAILTTLNWLQGYGLQKFDRHEMTRKELDAFRDLTVQIKKVIDSGGCSNDCPSGMVCCNGLCQQGSCSRLHH